MKSDLGLSITSRRPASSCILDLNLCNLCNLWTYLLPTDPQITQITQIEFGPKVRMKADLRLWTLAFGLWTIAS